MPAVEISVLGTEELTQALSLMTKDAKNNVNRALMKAGFLVEREAKVRCPVDTGRLKSSISTESKGESGEVMSEVIVAPHTNYAGFVEYGTSKQRAQPYMVPALNAKKEEIMSLVSSAVKEAVDKDIKNISKSILSVSRLIR